jgi:hypothetical protein
MSKINIKIQVKRNKNMLTEALNRDTGAEGPPKGKNI